MALTFLEAWRLRERIDGEGGSVRPWLLGIATNTARNLNRAARRHRETLARMRNADVVSADFAEDAAGRLDDTERLAAVHAALQRLRRPEREVLALCVWSDLSYIDAAEALGLPVGTVRSRLCRARAKLRMLSDEALSARNMSKGQRGSREPAPAPRQVDGGRAIAARSNQEAYR
jgi:RNA polymerase sigma-70 factor (ECF subfamily)